MQDFNGTTALTVLELFAGAGGMSMGLERAGFTDVGKVESDRNACQTLRMNRPRWNVLETDVRDLSGRDFAGVDLVAASLPTPPLSAAGLLTGRPEPTDVSTEALRVVREARPAAVLVEGIHGLGRDAYGRYRSGIESELNDLGYATSWRLLDASDFGVPQFRRRFFLIAVRSSDERRFIWPGPTGRCPTVGAALRDLMGVHGWSGIEEWAHRAAGIAPKIIGSAHAFGTLIGTTGPRNAWAQLGIDPMGIAESAPARDSSIALKPRLTNPMVARLQGLDGDWQVAGARGVAYQQIANATVPALAEAVGTSISIALGMRMMPHPSAYRLEDLDEGSRAPLRPVRRLRSVL